MTQAETNGTHLKTAERRAFVLDLRKSGATYRDIAIAAKKKFGDALPGGWDCRYAYKDVKRELTKLREEIGEQRLAVGGADVEVDGLPHLAEVVLAVGIAGMAPGGGDGGQQQQGQDGDDGNDDEELDDGEGGTAWRGGRVVAVHRRAFRSGEGCWVSSR